MRISPRGILCAASLVAACQPMLAQAGEFSVQLIGDTNAKHMFNRPNPVSADALPDLGQGRLVIDATTDERSSGATFTWRVVWKPGSTTEPAPRAAKVTFAWHTGIDFRSGGKQLHGWTITRGYSTTCALVRQSDGIYVGEVSGSIPSTIATKGTVVRKAIMVRSVEAAGGPGTQQ